MVTVVVANASSELAVRIAVPRSALAQRMSVYTPRVVTPPTATASLRPAVGGKRPSVVVRLTAAPSTRFPLTSNTSTWTIAHAPWDSPDKGVEPRSVFRLAVQTTWYTDALLGCV